MSDPPAPILRVKPVRARSGHTKTLENLAEGKDKPAKAPLPQPLALRLEPRAGIIVAGALKTGTCALDTLDRAARLLSTPVFAVHEAPLQGTSLEQIHSLPAMSAARSHELFRRASAFVCLGSEPLDPFLLDAAIHGCPLVLPETADLRATWDGAALFLRLEDTMALANALRRLLEDPEHRQRLALAALRRAQTLTRPKTLTPLGRTL